jgi:hypothetical protein
LNGWKDTQPDLAERVGRRVIADFRNAHDEEALAGALDRVLDALKIYRPEA